MKQRTSPGNRTQFAGELNRKEAQGWGFDKVKPRKKISKGHFQKKNRKIKIYS